jgi:probable rRNA maturation factor
VGAIMAAEKPAYRGEVNIAFVDRKTIRRLHKDHLGLDESTDVMAFPYPPAAGAELPFGDLSICVPEAVENARRFKDTPAREFKRLVIHGLLHLLGYDDHEPRKKALMWAQQEKWVNAFSGRRSAARRRA